MHLPLADGAAARYCPVPVEAASGPAPGAEKIKVGTTLTLIFRPRTDQSWYNPHFDFSRADGAGFQAVLTRLFRLCARANRPRSPSAESSSSASLPYFGQSSRSRPAGEAERFATGPGVREQAPMKTEAGRQSCRSPLECPSDR